MKLKPSINKAGTSEESKPAFDVAGIFKNKEPLAREAIIKELFIAHPLEFHDLLNYYMQGVNQRLLYSDTTWWLVSFPGWEFEEWWKDFKEFVLNWIECEIKKWVLCQMDALNLKLSKKRWKNKILMTKRILNYLRMKSYAPNYYNTVINKWDMSWDLIDLWLINPSEDLFVDLCKWVRESIVFKVFWVEWDMEFDESSVLIRASK